MVGRIARLSSPSSPRLYLEACSSASIREPQIPLRASDADFRPVMMSSIDGAMPSWLDTMPDTPAGSVFETVSGQLAGVICAA